MDSYSVISSENKRTAIVITAVVALAATTALAIAIPVTASVDTSERSINVTEVQPGGAAEVTVEATLANGGNRFQINDDFSPEPGFEEAVVTNISWDGGSLDPINDIIFATGEPTFIEVAIEQDFQAGDTVTINYTTTVPTDASDGETFNFDGIAAIDDTQEVAHSGDDQITVSTPDLSVTNYEVDKEVVKPNEDVTVTATVENPDSSSGELEVTLVTDGTDAKTETVSVAGGGTETVEFTTSFDQLGDFQVQVNDLAPKTVTVADVVVTDFSLDPTEVQPGETVDVEATVENRKSEQDSTDVSLSVNGEVVETQTVTVSGDTTDTVSFSTSFEEVGEYDVAVNELTPKTVDVVDILVTDYSVNNTRVEPGEPVGVEATVENQKSEADSLAVELYADGELLDSQTVNLDPGGTETVEFTTSFDEIGNTDLRINDLDSTRLLIGEFDELEITNFEVTTDGEELVITFDSTDTLADITAEITGAEEATLNENEFTGDSFAGYEATYLTGTDGSYTVELTEARDSSNSNGVDGGGDFSETVTVDASRDDVNGTATPAETDEPTGTDQSVETPDEEVEDQFGFGFGIALAALLAVLALAANRRE